MPTVQIGEEDDLNVDDIRRVRGIKPRPASNDVVLTIQHTDGLIEDYTYATIEEARAVRKAVITAMNGDDRSGKRLETK